MPSKVTLRGELLFPNDYLAALEFKGKDVTLTIAGIKVEELRMRGGAKENKPVVTFKETKKKLVCNKTNADSIAEMYGREATEWIGKRVTLYPTKTPVGRKMEDCIRVREKVPPATGQPQFVPGDEPPPPPQEPDNIPPTTPEDARDFLASLEQQPA